MVVLTDKKIIDYVKKKKLIISPFNKDAITPSGYDLTLNDFKSMHPNSLTIFWSKEKIELPNNIIAIPLLRSTYIYEGLVLSPGIIDAGFKGHLKIAINNVSKKTVKALPGQRGRPVTLLFIKTDGNVSMPFGHRHAERNDTQKG